MLNYKAEEVVFHPIPLDNPNGLGMYNHFKKTCLGGVCVKIWNGRGRMVYYTPQRPAYMHLIFYPSYFLSILEI